MIIEEIRAGEDDPTDLVGELSNKLVWEEQAVGRPIAGSEESVRRIDRAAMLGYLGDHYVPANLVISVAGNVTHAEVVRRAEESSATSRPANRRRWPRPRCGRSRRAPG